MLKDTKSLGNNKAPACESRGFVLKKEGVLFDTPSYYFKGTVIFLSISVKILMSIQDNKHYICKYPPS